MAGLRRGLDGSRFGSRRCSRRRGMPDPVDPVSSACVDLQGLPNGPAEQDYAFVERLAQASGSDRLFQDL
jgi:hypothetical protein